MLVYSFPSFEEPVDSVSSCGPAQPNLDPALRELLLDEQLSGLVLNFEDLILSFMKSDRCHPLSCPSSCPR